jgi:hypothetical protein
MPSNFATRFAEAAVPKLFDLHSEPITFDGNPVAAIVGAVDAEPKDFNDARMFCWLRTISVMTSDVPSPQRGQVAVIDGDEWTVDKVLGIEAGQAQLIMSRPVRLDGGARRFPPR